MTTTKKKNLIYVLDYIYKEVSAWRNDRITEKHLKQGAPPEKKQQPHQRILGYWDFHQRMAKTGDFIVFLEILCLLREKAGLQQEKNIDVCFINDPTHYNAEQERFQKSYAFKKMLSSLPILMPHLGSIHVFNSNKEFNRFYQQNHDCYLRWPPTVGGTIASNCPLIEELYAEQKTLPLLDIPEEIKQKVYRFYQQKVYPARPIIINIRNNKAWDNLRNSDLEEIERFLKIYQNDNRFKFIIISLPEEIPLELRKVNNVLFSKDHFQEIEEDLALIKTSYLGIFPSSGMACMAWFGNVPFIQHGPHGEDRYTRPQRGGYSWFNQFQRHFDEAPTAKWLDEKFKALVKDLEAAGIDNSRQEPHRDRETKENKKSNQS